MANWLHKTTLVYRVSDDPPVNEQGDWIRNPTLPPGVSSWSDVIVDGETVRAPNESEATAQAAAKLAAAKTAKMAAIDAKTAALITKGMGIEVATGKTISTSLPATQNLQNLWITSSLPGVSAFPQSISTMDGGTYVVTDSADMNRIAGILRTHQLGYLESGQALRASVLACTTIAQVDAITDGRT